MAKTVLFVGDAKYKRIAGQQFCAPNADLYQLLAYATALDLPGGLLIYAQGEADTAAYCTRFGTLASNLRSSLLILSGSLDQKYSIASRL